jgi:hypothetical protein
MSGRLSSSVLIGGLRRHAEAQGGFAMVLAKGDASAGSILVILAERGIRLRILERLLQPDGRYLWQDTSAQTVGNEEEIERTLERRRKYDPDLWVVELDIPSAERFAAEMNSVN